MKMLKTLGTVRNVPVKWHLIDAEGQVLGRLASKIAVLLQGKHKPEYAPHNDVGDYIVLINCDKVVCTTKNKKYFWHTGYPGGIKSVSFEDKLKAKPEEVLHLAVRRMLPKGPLGRAMLRKLKIYSGTDHPHAGQQPVLLADDNKKGDNL